VVDDKECDASSLNLTGEVVGAVTAGETTAGCCSLGWTATGGTDD